MVPQSGIPSRNDQPVGHFEMASQIEAPSERTALAWIALGPSLASSRASCACYEHSICQLDSGKGRSFSMCGLQVPAVHLNDAVPSGSESCMKQLWSPLWERGGLRGRRVLCTPPPLLFWKGECHKFNRIVVQSTLLHFSSASGPLGKFRHFQILRVHDALLQVIENNCVGKS